MEIVWDDLVDAFENSGEELLYFLDRDTGEIFTVPVYYDDPDFWDELTRSGERYLQVPPADPDQERFVVYDFIRKIEEPGLKRMLEETFVGNRRFGRLDDILAFYPEELERLQHLREELVTGRIRNWLEEHDIFPHEEGK